MTASQRSTGMPAARLAESWRMRRSPPEADASLEQHGHGRAPGAVVGVVDRGERDRAVGAADAGDDRGQDVGELRGEEC